MDLPRIRFGSPLYDRTLALYTGEVKLPSFALDFNVVDHPRELFDRQNASAEFDACEMSASEYITRYSSGDRGHVAIPVFPSRMFRHGFIVVNNDLVKEPKDLAGKRIGVQSYTMTAAVWIRGLLQNEYGVDLTASEWVEGALDRAGEYKKSSGSSQTVPERISRTRDKSLDQLLLEGEIAAIIGAELPPSLGKNPKISRLFPDFKDREMTYYRNTGIFPTMHLVVVRRDVYEKTPHICRELFEALEKSKQICLQKMHFMSVLRYTLPWLKSALEETDAVFGADPWPYGLEKNRKPLETLLHYLEEQHLLSGPVSLEELFVRVE